MRAIRRDKDCCGCGGLADRISQMWERLQETITAIRFNGEVVHPDGAGLADLGDFAPGARLEDLGEYSLLTILDADFVALIEEDGYWTLRVT